MAKLYFRYGCMNSGKTVDLLKTWYNYKECYKTPVIISCDTDTRSGRAKVKSRIKGLEADATPISHDTNILGIYTGMHDNADVILVDEAQFLSRDQVIELGSIVDDYGVPVICYGLRDTFKGTLFEGSKALFEYADTIQELVTLCHFCNHKATMHLLKVDGKYCTEGNDVHIGDTEFYSVCRKHYFENIGYPEGINL